VYERRALLKASVECALTGSRILDVQVLSDAVQCRKAHATRSLWTFARQIARRRCSCTRPFHMLIEAFESRYDEHLHAMVVVMGVVQSHPCKPPNNNARTVQQSVRLPPTILCATWSVSRASSRSVSTCVLAHVAATSSSNRPRVLCRNDSGTRRMSPSKEQACSQFEQQHVERISLAPANASIIGHCLWHFMEQVGEYMFVTGSFNRIRWRRQRVLMNVCGRAFACASWTLVDSLNKAVNASHAAQYDAWSLERGPDAAAAPPFCMSYGAHHVRL